MNTLQKIQQDIEKCIDEADQAQVATDAVNYADVSAIRASFKGTMLGCRDLAQLLLRLSNVKPTGLYPSSSANEESEKEPALISDYSHLWSARVRKLMHVSQFAARRYNHEYVGSEHILLGLTRLPHGVAVEALRSMGIDPRRVRYEIDKLISLGRATADSPAPQLTPRAKKAMEYAFEEATSLKCAYIGSEHILLGLLREKEGVAAQVLLNLGITLEAVRQEVKELLGLCETSLKEETSALPQRQTLRELSKDGQKVRKQHWAPEEYVVLDAEGRIICGTLSLSCEKIGCDQLDYAGDWEVYDDTAVDTTHVHEKRVRAEEEDDEHTYRFYYCHSEDAYLLGLRVGNFYYARWKEGGYFQFEMSRHLPWGEPIPSNGGGCYRYPSKPVELDFQLWLKGFLAQRVTEAESKKPVARRYEEKKLYRWDGKDFVPYEEEKSKTTGLTFLEATKDGQKARRPKWKPGIWVKFSCRQLEDQSCSPTNLHEEDYHANDWEIYKEPVKTTVEETPVPLQTAEEASVPPQRQTLLDLSKGGRKVRRPHWHPGMYVILDSAGYICGGSADTEVMFCNGIPINTDSADTWELFDENSLKTMTGYEAAKLVMEGKTVKRVSRWNVHFKAGGHTPFELTKENLEAADWIEVTDE